MEAILEVLTSLLGDVDYSAIISTLTSVVSYLVEIISGLM